MSQTSKTASGRPLRILSLDGGGIRGISSLLILDKIMQGIRDNTRDLNHVPRPCEYFDLIGGTSTGGIIAIMLGRLGMTIDECLEAYRKVGRQAFTPRWGPILPGRPTGAFSATALEAAVRQMIREFCSEGECATRRQQGKPTIETCTHDNIAFQGKAYTKTVVLAITKDNVDAPPTLFKTYDTSSAFSSCTIWQIARATSAATTFFKSIKIGRDDIEFIDAGFGYNNPCQILIEESKQQFPGCEQRLVLSIGTGLGDVVTIRDTRMSIVRALAAMATSSRRVARDLLNIYGENGHYYRFNVDRGLDDITLSDWERSSTISAHTHNYLDDERSRIRRCVDDLIDASGARPIGILKYEERQHVWAIELGQNLAAFAMLFAPAILPDESHNAQRQQVTAMIDRILLFHNIPLNTSLALAHSDQDVVVAVRVITDMIQRLEGTSICALVLIGEFDCILRNRDNIGEDITESALQGVLQDMDYRCSELGIATEELGKTLRQRVVGTRTNVNSLLTELSVPRKHT
ncbi:hypothetical protein ASPACDRAFT_63446 [Aspergillus aculeatus ATCC 16872]|uniref:PNPLA domain-containing protein n=1 Tax=Aspergillus aculeatus (strain ATCC 16872 / CBS 172.66 / WB 5094) TaxID=690307 RepID=A0A1L9WK25_ASPA1|nr:uncharacterized protein ASPACDRAFT_63446 [Aspergillus aculeatus ATCC 16872]OJJ96527.1 hypothetical protein ASPACDRAFT_63446 [Aspergillus aculeatus ATCC 16872]